MGITTIHKLGCKKHMEEGCNTTVEKVVELILSYT